MFAFSLAFLKRMNILEVIYVPSASAQTPSATARNSEGFTSVHSERISGAATGMLLPLEAIWPLKLQPEEQFFMVQRCICLVITE